MIRLTKAYITAIGLVFIFICTIQLFRSSSAPSTGWSWSSGEGPHDPEVITATPPKFERPPHGQHGSEGALPKDGFIDDHRWSDKVPTSAAPVVLPPATTDLTEPKAGLKPVSGDEEAVKGNKKPAAVAEDEEEEEEEEEAEAEGEEAEETTDEEEKLDEDEGPKMMLEADCSAKKASIMEPLPSLNTTFHVPDDIHYSVKGPDPSEVVIVTASDGKGHNGGIQDILGQTAANRKAYCEHHGYNYHFVNISQFDLDNAHPVWKKIPAIVDAFNTYPKAQWVFFLDLDAIIMSPKQDLNSLILSHAGMSKSLDFGVEWHWADRRPLGVYMPNEQDVKFDELDMLVAQDQNGVNAGSFFLRRSKFTQIMLDMWADPFFMQHDWPGQEQDTLLHFIKHHKTFRQHLGLIKQRVANAYSVGDDAMKWQPGDLVVHFAGCWVGNDCQERWEEMWAKKGSLSPEYDV